METVPRAGLPCDAPNCGLVCIENLPFPFVLLFDEFHIWFQTFENDDLLESHMRKHLLNLELPERSKSAEIQARCIEETPTPSRFLKNFSNVATDFLDGIDATQESPDLNTSSPFSITLNPFAEQFRRASFSSVPKLQIPDQATKLLIDENSESLNTPSITINPATKSPEAPKGSEETSVVEVTSGPLVPEERTATLTVDNVQLFDNTFDQGPLGKCFNYLEQTCETIAKVKKSMANKGSEKAGTPVSSNTYRVAQVKDLKKILPKLPAVTKLIVRTPGFSDISIPIPLPSTKNVPTSPDPSISGTEKGVKNLVVTPPKEPTKFSYDATDKVSSSQSSSQSDSNSGSQTSSQSSTSSSSQSSSGDSGSQEKKSRGRTPKFLYEGITDKTERHRVRNREAAMRCREKKKMWKSSISSTIDELNDLKESLFVSKNDMMNVTSRLEF